jgi:site-specific DNA recombinase
MNDRNLKSLRYKLYARKSTDTEDKQVQSLEDQETMMRRMAKSEGLRIIGETIFESRSAKLPNNRPAFEELIKEIEDGKIDGVLCWKIDRLSRNPTDSGRIQQLLQDGKLKHIRTNEKSYFPEDNAIVFSVEASMSNQYIRELAVNTRRGMELKADRGHKPGIPPIGYLNDRINKVVIPDPERFHLVRILWDKMLTGTYSMAQIQHYADKELHLKSVVRTKIGGTPIAYSTLCAMFKNEFYTGALPFKGQVLPGKHDAMISKAEFDRVQEIIDPSHTTRPKDKTYNFELRNLFRCGECGFAITAEEKRKNIKSTGEVRKYVYYHCTGKNKSIKCTQPKLHVSETVLLEQIKDKLSKFTIDPEFYKLAIEALAQEEDIVVAKDQSLADSHDKELAKAKEAITRLRRMRYNGEAEDDAWYMSEMQLLEDNLEQLQDQRNDAEYKARDWRAMADEVFTFARYAKEDFDSDDLEKKRSVIVKLGEVLTIKDRTIRFTPNKYFIPLENMNERQNNAVEMVRTDDLQIKTPALQHGSLSWLRGLDSNQRPSG